MDNTRIRILKEYEMNMRLIWKQLINELDEQIAKVEINKDGKLQQLYKKRELLEMAMNRV